MSTLKIGIMLKMLKILFRLLAALILRGSPFSEKSYKCSVNKISVKISHHLSCPNAKITFIKLNWLNKPSVTMVSNYFQLNPYSFCENRCNLGRDKKKYFLLVPDACKWRRLFFIAGDFARKSVISSISA